ncbi:SDR family oxidoreductase [Flavobacterium sp. DG2-3]|mgnify:CR=1 FL=1|uniref:SDR family NAD(P)-dependent oxidoreductase n=1 Tax=Flavobacterium sp. DG2-3 TaxID=3068317 RepID=UPI00273F5699|nr:SDR family oxidoreductase [Flavobacterium sp. DG2-3]MDP5200329.1 SDR family oxidoreductase [Flavobacterium sp. DG2-3]
MENNHQYALITGATQGIGYELAKLFAKDGYNLVIVARSQNELDTVAQELRLYGIKAITSARDLFITEEVFGLCDELEQSNIEVNILVNNAGQGVYGLFKDTDLNRELDIVHLNINAPIILAKHFLSKMLLRNEGRILNVASIASKAPGPWQSVYHGTKAFILSFSEALRSELEGTNITVTALLPGPTDTDFFNKAGMNESKAVQDKDSLADPADVAKDGYNALMNNKDRIISGFSNKLKVGMSNVLSDSLSAEVMKEQQKPVNGE